MELFELISPQLILAWLFSAIGIIAGTAAFTHHVDSLAFQAYLEQQAAIAEKAAATSEAHARQVEEQDESKQANIVASYQEQLRELSKTHEVAVRAIRNSAQRMHVGDAHPGATGMSKTTASPSRAYAAGTNGLSSDDAEFLIGESERADKLAAKITALQKIVTEDRIICDGNIR